MQLCLCFDNLDELQLAEVLLSCCSSLHVKNAKTQMDKLEALGFGKPILLNEVEDKVNIEQ